MAVNSEYFFALKLYQILVDGSNENVFISPYSISIALSMVLLGAKNNSADELQKGLGFANICPAEVHGMNLEVLKQLKLQEHVTLEVANQLFPELSYPLLDDFVSSTLQFYQTALKGLDFINKPEESRLEINQWASDKTHGKIEDLLPNGSINSLVRLVIANAVYFKGDWAAQFKKELTKKEAFYAQPDETKSVDMMSRKGKYNMGYNQELGVQVVELPYKGKSISMMILLPTDRFGLKKLGDDLTASSLSSLLDENNLYQKEIILSLPKMKLEYSCDLVESLQKLGIRDIFDAGKANLSGVSGGPDLFVSSVAHKAFVEINEEGTEAAAATAAVMMMRSLPARPIAVKCDHPFLFVIKHKESNSVLFIGRLNSP